MRDAALRTTLSLPGTLGGTATAELTANATYSTPAIFLGTAGTPIIHPMLAEVNYPAAPGGTTPSIIASLWHSADGTNWSYLERLHDVTTATSAFPKLFRRRFQTVKPFVRVQFTLFSADNSYGNVGVSVSMGASRGHKETN